MNIWMILHPSELTEIVSYCSSCSIYVQSAYKMVHSVAHLTQHRLKPLAPSRGIYIVGQYGAP